MKIVIDGRLYGLENAGLGRYVMNLVKELSLIDQDNNYVLLLRKKYLGRLNLPANWKEVGLDLPHYGILEQIVLPHFLYKEKPDLVHFPHFNVPILYWGRYVVTIHDLLMHTFRGKEATTRGTVEYLIKRLGYRGVFALAVKRARKIIVPSEVVKTEVADYYHLNKNRICVTYEGLDQNIIRESASDKGLLKKLGVSRPYLIYVGNAYPHKNLDGAIAAVRIFNSSNAKKLQLVIVSSRNYFIEKLTSRLQHKEFAFVKILHFIPDNELGILLKNSTAFIYPSLSEGFGLQGLESIASGTLVLASNIPAFKEIYRDNVIYFDPHDNTSIVEAISQVMTMEPLTRAKLISKSQQFIQRYSWAKMAAETLQVYAESRHSLRPGQ